MRDRWLFLGLGLVLALVVGEGKRGLVVLVVVSTLAVAPKGWGHVGVGVPKVQEGLEVCMWGCSGSLGKIGRV